MLSNSIPDSFPNSSEEKYIKLKEEAINFFKGILRDLKWDYSYFEKHERWEMFELQSVEDPVTGIYSDVRASVLLDYMNERLSYILDTDDDYEMCVMVYNFLTHISRCNNINPIETLIGKPLDFVCDSNTRAIFLAYVEVLFTKYKLFFGSDGAILEPLIYDLPLPNAGYRVRIGTLELDEEKNDLDFDDEDLDNWDDDYEPPDDNESPDDDNWEDYGEI